MSPSSHGDESVATAVIGEGHTPRLGRSARRPVWPDRPRMLVSYAYARQTGLGDLPGQAELVIDSGAFTALNTGAVIDVDEYTDWLVEHRGQFRFAFALDVIGDPAASRVNYERQMARLGDDSGVTLLPAWHIGSDFAELEHLCSVAGYVAIGGAVRHFANQNMLMRQLVKAHQIAAKYGTKLHGLGVTGAQVVGLLPWASVDSSSWTYPARRPLMYLADQSGRMVSFHRGQPLIPAHARLVKAYGGDPNIVANPTASQPKFVGKDVASVRLRWGVVAAARSYMWVEAVKRLSTPEFRLYLASAPKDREPVRAWEAGPPYPAG